MSVLLVCRKCETKDSSISLTKSFEKIETNYIPYTKNLVVNMAPSFKFRKKAAIPILLSLARQVFSLPPPRGNATQRDSRAVGEDS